MKTEKPSGSTAGKLSLLLILLVCLMLRVGLSVREARKPLDGDALTYAKIAVHIARGDGFVTGPIETPNVHWPTAFGNPVYPAFLAAVFRVFGFSVIAVMLIQSLIDTFTCFLVFRMARITTGSRSAALLAALLYAFYPPFIISAASVLTETLTLLLLTAALFFYWRYTSGGLSNGVAAGLLTGVNILLRPALLALPVFLMAGFWLNRRRDPGWLARSLIYVVISFAVVAPWTIRNYIVMGAFIPVSSHGGQTLWGGAGPADGVCLGGPDQPLAIKGSPEARQPGYLAVSKQAYDRIQKLRESVKGLGEVERDRVYRKAAVREIREHPGRFAFLAVKKFFRLWFNLWHDESPSRKSLALAGLNLGLLVFGALGCLGGLADRRFVQAALLLAVYISLVSMFTFSLVRYSYPVFPFVIIFAAAFVVERRGPKQHPAA